MAAAAAVFLLCLLVFLIYWQRRSGSAEGQARSSFQVWSASFSDGGAIPPEYTCDGADLSPNLQWGNAPAGTKSLAVVVHDPDAPADFTHWVAYNIPPGARELAEGASAQSAMPPGSAEGVNSFDRLGYGGPCPPPGEPHHYFFHVYALDVRLDLPQGAGREQLDAAMRQHIVAEGEIVGVYRRGGE